MAQDRAQGQPLISSVLNLEFCYQIQSNHDMALLSVYLNYVLLTSLLRTRNLQLQV
jgi:hypothetical protein